LARASEQCQFSWRSAFSQPGLSNCSSFSVAKPFLCNHVGTSPYCASRSVNSISPS
jgi:hypothetical protein